MPHGYVTTPTLQQIICKLNLFAVHWELAFYNDTSELHFILFDLSASST